jgi:type I restriction enzyme S subunit
MYTKKEILNENEWKKLVDIVNPNGVFCDGDWVESKDQDINGDIRLIQLADIGDGKFRNKSNRFLTFKKAIELNCTFLKQGDILIASVTNSNLI